MNSSDIEFTPPKPNPFANAGRRGLKKLKSNPDADRIQSKKASKNLQLTLGSPEKQYLISLWYNRFNVFRESVLQKDVASIPTGEDIERFLDTIVRHVTPSSSLVPSKAWIEKGLANLKTALTFYCPQFTLSAHEDVRLECTIGTLLKDGRLTTECKERQWVGAALVKTMTMALLENAIDDGTKSWDHTANDILMLVLTSSLQCRAGDIMRSWIDKHPFPYIMYSDIVMKFVGGFQIENLVARVKIRNEKGHK